MEELLARVWENLGERVSGPMWFRLILQPAVAVFFAARDGLKDERLGRPPYFWKVLTNHHGHRNELIRDGWTSISKVFIMAILIDGIYQFIVQRWIYPLELVTIAILLAVVPYVLVRGPLNRLVSLFRGGKVSDTQNDG